MALPTLADLKTHMNITFTKDDDELVEVLDAAVEVVANIVGPLEQGSVTENHYGATSPVLLLRRMPVGEVTAVSMRSMGYSGLTTLTLADYEVDEASGLLRMANGGYFYGDYTVTYTTGRDTLPAAIRLAILIIGKQLWETQRAPGQTSDLPAGFGGMDGIADAGSSTAMGFAIPSRATELLQPYLRQSTIA